MTTNRVFVSVLRALGLVAILFCCYQAQVLFLNERSETGYLWLGAAGVVALLVVVPAARPNFAALDPGTLDAARGWRRWLGLLLLIPAVVLLVQSGRLFHEQFSVTPYLTDGAWFQYLAGLALALIGGLLLVGVGRLPVPRLHLLIVLAIFAFAVFLRVYQLDQYPFGVWYDEAIYGIRARSVLLDPGFRPFYGENLTFPHLVFYAMGLQTFGFANIVGVRIVSALLASVGVFVAYLVGRELRGVWFGILLAFLLAVIRWSVNFSRIGMTGAELSTFVLLAFYFAIRLARYGRLRDALWFGVALGVGVYFYRAYLVQVLAVAAYLLLAYPFLRRSWKRTVALAGTALLALVVVLIPVGIFAVDQPNEYWTRLNQVSIYNEGLPDVNAAIVESTVKHLEMFHLRGDNNGRHNLPGEPMLDPVMGSLAVIGLFVALRERRREHLVFLISLVIALTGGIFSVSFEAPQGLRVIGVITAVIYFSALGLDGMARTAAAALQTFVPKAQPRLVRGVVAFAALVLLFVLCAWNVNIYFNRQRTNPVVWSSFFTDATLTARFFTRYDDATQFFISPLIGISPPVSFLAEKESARAVSLVMPDALPLRVPNTTHAVVMLLPNEQHYVDYMRRIYPDATYTPVRPVDYGVEADPANTLFTAIELEPEDIGSIQGLRDGEGVLYVPYYEPYTFSFDGEASVEIDGAPVSDGDAVLLAQGNHRLVVNPADGVVNWQYSAAPEGEPIPEQFLYHAPVTVNGLHATFYADDDWEGAPAVERIAPFLWQYIHIVPMERPYSVRYTGYLYAPTTGDYEFLLQARDTAALDIDGVNVLAAAPEDEGRTTIVLEQGWHPVEVRFQDLTSATSLYLNWKPPGIENMGMLTLDYLCPEVDICPTPQSN